MSRPATQTTAPADNRPPRTVRRRFLSRRTIIIAAAVAVALILVIVFVPIRRRVHCSGELYTVRKAELRPSVEGVIGQWLAHSGGDVTENQLVIQLKDELQRAAHDQAASELKAKRAELERLVTSQHLSRAERQHRITQSELTLKLHKSRYDRMTEAQAAGASFSTKELEEAKLRVDLAQADLAALQLSRDEVMDKQVAVLTEQIITAEKLTALHKAELELRRVSAPIAGTVELETLYPGEVVKPERVLGHIYDTSAWMAKLKVGERHFPHIARDQPVRIEITGYPAMIYGYIEGRVRRVRPLITPLSTGEGVFIVYVAIDAIPPKYTAQWSDASRPPAVKATVWADIDAGQTTWLMRLIGW